jgi:hypothetical protein
VDDFTRKLWQIYETVRSEGVAQPLTLAILRNDFMLDKNKEGLEVGLSQIEINTVSISFGAAASKMTLLHRNMLSYTDNERFITQVGCILSVQLVCCHVKANLIFQLDCRQ